LNSEEERFQQQTSFVFNPTWWLIRLGICEGMHIRLSNSSVQGWRFYKTPSRLVPNDSAIFSCCKQGDVKGVIDLFKNGHASIWDVNDEGWNPLMVR